MLSTKPKIGYPMHCIVVIVAILLGTNLAPFMEDEDEKISK